jgi:hypothetical protein
MLYLLFDATRTRATSNMRDPPTTLLADAPASSGVHQLDHHANRETVRQQGRLGAAVAAGGEQFERAAAVGLRRRGRGIGG